MEYYFTHDNLSSVLRSEITIEEKANQIWNLIGSFLQKSLYLKFKTQGYVVGLEYDDFYTIAYLGFYDLVSKAKNLEEIIKDKGFISFCKKRCDWYCSDYLRKFFTWKGKTLNINNIISISSEIIDNLSIPCARINDSEEIMNLRVEIDRIMESLMNDELFDNKIKKDFSIFIKMITNGCTRREIKEKLNITEYEYRRFEDILRKKVELFE